MEVRKMVATMTSKGQITLPVGLRRQMGLNPGDRLDFATAADGTVSLRTVKSGIVGLAGIARPTDKRRRTLKEMDEAIAKGRQGAKA
jgi:AbrB family looped-hinge helix DNA binding protein